MMRFFARCENSTKTRRKLEMAAIAWNSHAGLTLLNAGSVRCFDGVGLLRAGRRLSPAAGCGHLQGVGVELPSRNQPYVADGDPDGHGSVDVDESTLEQRTEQGRLPGGC